MCDSRTGVTRTRALGTPRGRRHSLRCRHSNKPFPPRRREIAPPPTYCPGRATSVTCSPHTAATPQRIPRAEVGPALSGALPLRPPLLVLPPLPLLHSTPPTPPLCLRLHLLPAAPLPPSLPCRRCFFFCRRPELSSAFSRRRYDPAWPEPKTLPQNRSASLLFFPFSFFRFS